MANPNEETQPGIQVPAEAVLSKLVQMAEQDERLALKIQNAGLMAAIDLMQQAQPTPEGIDDAE